MASARKVGRGPDKKWLAVGELRALLLEVLAPSMQVECGGKGLWGKLHVCYMVQCCRMSAVLWLWCVACMRRLGASKMGFNQICIFARSCMFVAWCSLVRCFFLWWHCVGCCRWMIAGLPNWKNFAKELFHKVLSGSVVLCRKYSEMSFAPWLLRLVCRHEPMTHGWQ